jgi:DUF4097 and DUF4098 domain-containing protein YvlB
MRLQARWIVPVIAAGAMLAGCVSPLEAPYRVDRTWPADAIERIEVKSVNSAVEVTASNDDVISLEALVYGRQGSSADEVIDISVSRGVLTIRQREKRRRFSIGARHKSGRIALVVPERVSAKLSTVNGRIVVDGVGGKLAVTTVNGSIEVTTPAAQLEARTVNGRVRARFTEGFSGGKFKTVNGSVNVTVPHNSAVELDLHQVNGSFRSNIPVTVNSGSPATAGGKRPLEIRTVNGSVTLQEIAIELPKAAQPEEPAEPDAPTT